MTPTTERRVRGVLQGAALAAMLAAGACAAGSSGPSIADAPSSVAASTPDTPDTTAPAAPVTVAPSASPPPSTAGIDPGAALQGALAALGTSYHFTTTINVGGAPAVVAEGDRVGDGSRLTIDGPGGRVEYVVLPSGTWVRPEDGEWEALDTPPASADPLLALRAPTAVSVTSADAAATRLAVGAPAAALGIPGPADAVATVQLVLTGGAVTSLTYEATLGGEPAVVEAVFGPLVDPDPVVAPV